MTEGVRFRVWGCRGSLPVPGATTLRYGGDTSCYELSDADGWRLVIDCGSGMRALGERMMGEGPPDTLDILLSHLHFDHLIGLGFFAPLLARRTRLNVHSPLDPAVVEAAIGRLFGPPLWPLRIAGDYPVRAVRLAPGTTAIGPAEVSSFPLNHPGGASGYRIRLGGRTICSVTDHEHGDAAVDAGIAEAVRDADLMIYDAAYTDREYLSRRGWGHSTWEEAARLAAASAVARTLLVHHSTQADDDEIDAKPFPGAPPGRMLSLARDGMELTL
jgi:phosphoribosyl 1,2-cyclic phosphodiesterase